MLLLPHYSGFGLMGLLTKLRGSSKGRAAKSFPIRVVNGDFGHMREGCTGRLARNRSHFSNSTTANVKTPMATM